MRDDLLYSLRLHADMAIKAVLAFHATEKDDPGMEAIPLVIKELPDELVLETHCLLVAKAALALEAAELCHREITRRKLTIKQD